MRTAEDKKAIHSKYKKAFNDAVRAVKTGSTEPRKPLETQRAIAERARAKKWQEDNREAYLAKLEKKKEQYKTSKEESRARVLAAIAQADKTQRNVESDA